MVFSKNSKRFSAKSAPLMRIASRNFFDRASDSRKVISLRHFTRKGTGSGLIPSLSRKTNERLIAGEKPAPISKFPLRLGKITYKVDCESSAENAAALGVRRGASY